MDENEPLCARCARRRKTCCQISEVYLTPGDVQRIQAFTGGSDFFEYRVPVNPEYADQAEDPEWARCVFRPDGSRRILRRCENGDCVFLGPQGCGLPWEVRPLVCRLYPVRYTARGLEPDLQNGCPTELLPPGQDLLAALGMTLPQAERWHWLLYLEIRQEPHLAENEAAEPAAERDCGVEQPGVTVRMDGQQEPVAVVPKPGGVIVVAGQRSHGEALACIPGQKTDDALLRVDAASCRVAAGVSNASSGVPTLVASPTGPGRENPVSTPDYSDQTKVA